MIGQHINICTVRDGKNMGRHFATALATIHLGATQGVHRVSLIGIDGDTEEPRIGLNRNVQMGEFNKMLVSRACSLPNGQPLELT